MTSEILENTLLQAKNEQDVCVISTQKGDKGV